METLKSRWKRNLPEAMNMSRTDGVSLLSESATTQDRPLGDVPPSTEILLIRVEIRRQDGENRSRAKAQSQHHTFMPDHRARNVVADSHHIAIDNTKSCKRVRHDEDHKPAVLLRRMDAACACAMSASDGSGTAGGAARAGE